MISQDVGYDAGKKPEKSAKNKPKISFSIIIDLFLF
jgi:hypothetical protein